MNIVFTADDHFIRQVTTAVISILENNKDTQLSIYLLSKGITNKHKSILKKMVEGYSQSFFFIEIKDLTEYFNEAIDTGGWNDIVLARLFFDIMLPSHIDRLIYLDGDVIVRHSLLDLWNTDLGSKILGMVVEPTASKTRKKDLGITPKGSYYNAGVMLIDLKKWREKKIKERILRYYKAHNNYLFANDQDAINGELKDEIYPLPITYNYCNTYYYYPYTAIRKMIPDYNLGTKDDYMKAIADPCIIHFLGEERPWREGNKHIYRNDFIKYYKMTPFGEKTHRSDGVFEFGWNRYFFFWNIFNRIMRFFPRARLVFINSLIPVMLSIRKKRRRHG